MSASIIAEEVVNFSRRLIACLGGPWIRRERMSEQDTTMANASMEGTVLVSFRLSTITDALQETQGKQLPQLCILMMTTS